jgi:hypothetical protein
VTIRWRRHIDHLGARGLVEVYWEPLDERVYGPDPKPTVADCGYTVVAKLLAEPLRRAFEKHLDQHGCAERHGFAYCEEAMQLFGLLPPGDTVILG